MEDAEAAWAAVAPSGPEAATLAGETARDVWAAAAALSPREYSVLHYQLRDGLDAAEIAAVMGLRAGTVHTAMTRARQGLEEAFAALQLARRVDLGHRGANATTTAPTPQRTRPPVYPSTTSPASNTITSTQPATTTTTRPPPTQPPFPPPTG